ncbi:DUF7352 domain-containing protein [Pseudomonas abyssi]|jgi:hypothetical protein|uniref:DUF7352 domain-containing protein n=1 Tax=Pseudomonas abyssi TaxID=170540 RepID=A0A395R730_9PSED|nr:MULTISPECIES: hypothetical protein [Pseudomonadaceae]RGP55920.1 hypothetical protein ASB58_00575 [Halopseudomonas gallaeciensis]|tara:strand:- start:623 stop:970 length:348 start_codon:yes stop_codon:yes gene_type:complete
MKTIHQYILNSDKKTTTLALREGYRIVRCEYLLAQKKIYLWVEESLSIDLPTIQRQFVVIESGAAVPLSYRHVDTALDPFGPQAFHVYEVAQPHENQHAGHFARPAATLHQAQPA